MNDLKQWTWTELKHQVSGFWPIGHSLPEQILSESDFEKKTRDSFAAGAAVFFEPLRASQPLVWAQLMASTDVQMVQNKQYPILIDVVVASHDRAYFIEPFAYSDDEDYWREIFAYLPDFLTAYYQNFNGMRGSRFMPAAPGNLPANNRRWHRVSDYVKESSVDRKTLKRLRSDFSNIDELYIFLKTDWGDLVFLDRNTASKKIYVVPEGKFLEYFELNNAAQVIDELCAHVLGGATAPFYLQKFQ